VTAEGASRVCAAADVRRLTRQTDSSAYSILLSGLEYTLTSLLPLTAFSLQLCYCIDGMGSSDSRAWPLSSMSALLQQKACFSVVGQSLFFSSLSACPWIEPKFVTYLAPPPLLYCFFYEKVLLGLHEANYFSENHFRLQTNLF